MSFRHVRIGRYQPFEAFYRWLDVNRLFAQRALIIPPLLILVALLGFNVPQQYHTYVMLLPAAIGGAVFFLKFPPLRTMFMIVVSMTTRLIFLRIGLTVIVLFALTGLWLFDMISRQRRITLVKSPTIPPLMLFVAIVVISFGLGQLPWYPIPPASLEGQIGQVAIFLSAVFAFLLAAHQVDDIRWLQIFVYTFLILGSVFLVGRFFPRVAFLQDFLVDPTAVGSPFWVWIVATAFSQAVFNTRMKGWARVLFGIVAITAFYLSIFQTRSWTSGWMPIIVTLGVILWVGKPKLAIFVTVIGFLLVLVNLQAISNEFIFIGDNDYSLLTRVEAWRIVFAIIKVNPILGLGPANYRSYTTLFPILGYYVEFNSHNNYIDLIAQVGFAGLGVFLWFFAEVGLLAWRLLKVVPKGSFAHAYIYGCLGGWAATLFSGMLGDWIVPFMYNGGANAMRASVMIWLFLGGLVAIEQLYLAKSESREDGTHEISNIQDLLLMDKW